MFGSAKYRNYKYGADDHVAVVHTEDLPKHAAIFLTSAIHKSSCTGKFDYGRNFYAKDADQLNVLLPSKEHKPDYEIMDRFIAELEAKRIKELEAYLSAAGLKDFQLTVEEHKALDDFDSGLFVWKGFKFKDIFEKITQGRRLKKDDQIPGNTPFVMAGVTNTGVVNYISNPVASFSKNSITIDIFGNAFYRNYDFGAGDDTGVFWSETKNYSKDEMLFFTTSMKKSLERKFDYGNKLRSSQSLNLEMQLLTKNSQLDLPCMEILISAVKKLVIKDVVLYLDSQATK